jgi:hypothetical protein
MNKSQTGLSFFNNTWEKPYSKYITFVFLKK